MGYYEKHYLQAKTCWATIGNNWATVIPASGHPVDQYPTPKITIATINRHAAAAIHAQGLDALRGAY